MIDINPDCLYLTSTERLAHSLHQRFRTRCMDEGKQGWESLQAMSLNAWFARTWTESWPEEMPAPDLYRLNLYRLNLWKKLAGRITPPSPLSADMNLCAILDENYGIMVRHGLDPAAGFPSTPLVEWRRKISGAFRKTLTSNSLFHPSLYPVLLRRAILEGEITCPDRISLAGFEAPTPVEHELFMALGQKSNLEYVNFPAGKPEKVEAIALPSPEQEAIYLVHRLARDARTIPLHRIGVVVPDMDRYAKMLERNLQAVTADAPPHGAHWFNMTKGVPLIETHLMNAALLPLRFILEGQPRELLLSFILSPYYEWRHGRRHEIARADIIWRKHSIEYGLENLLFGLERETPHILNLILSNGAKHLFSFCKIDISRKRKGVFWIKQLEDLWNHFGFPVLSGEKDTVDKKHLDEIMEEMGKYLSKTFMDGHEFSAWLTHLASHKMVQISAPEDAGIQILELSESRGLDFDKLYVLGMDDQSIPQPARPLPFLDSAERKLVQGATAESQYEFAKSAFGHLMSLAPDITLLRAEQEELKPLTPSPFWPGNEEKKSTDIWNVPDPAWLRAGWLRSAYDGLNERVSPEPPEDPFLNPDIIPGTVSVSRFQKAIVCPYRFFAECILNINPLEDIQPAVSPREKGIRIHQTLALFTQKLRERGLNLNMEGSKQKALVILSECVDKVLRDVADNPHWEVERKRWTGTGGDYEGGILTECLDREIERNLEGWRCIAEESAFETLEIEGLPFSLKGRIDRVDFSKDRGVILWDYKTGALPSAADIVTHLKEPQLVIYLLALLRGKIPGLEAYIGSHAAFSAGYIQLKSAGDIRLSPVKGIESSLDEWTMAMSRLGDMLGSGDFSARPFPVSEVTGREKTCEKCPFITMCRMGIRDQRSETGDPEAENAETE